MDNITIRNIISTEYDGENIIYVPSSKSKEIRHIIRVDYTNNILVENFKVALIDSSTGFKYKLFNINYNNNGEGTYDFYFNVDYQSTELANIDFIELILYNSPTESGLSGISLKKEIKVRHIQSSDKSLLYSFGDVKINDTNLLALRNQIQAPSWGTVRKNVISNGAKLLENLHSVFNSSYFKVNEYLRQSYDLTYEPYDYERINLTQRPLNISRETDEGLMLLKETSDINSSIKKLEVTYNPSDTLSIYTVILEPYSEIIDELEKINENLPQFIYLKKNKNGSNKYVTCVITGYDEFEELIVESLLVRYDIYTRTKNRFHKIVNINYSDTTVEISNYVDLRYNHYVINNSIIIPPIVDNEYKTFKPLIKKQSNNELDRDVITIYNPLSENVNPVIKFNIDEPNIRVRSLYVTEDLDVIYSLDSGEGSRVCYSKLNIDFSKNIYNNITINNNKYIQVSDENTSTGDWVDIHIDLEAWSRDITDEAFLIQIRNKNEIYYYNYETKSITADKVIIYKQTINNTFIDFSLQVETTDPYIITIFDSTLKNKASAMTSNHTLVAYESIGTSGTLLILYDNEIISTNNIIEDSPLYLQVESDYLYFILEWDEYSTLDYRIDFGSYYLSNIDTNINPEYVEYITKDNEYGSALVIKIDRSFTDNEYCKIGTGFNINNGFINESTLHPSAKITVKLNDESNTLNLTPKLITDIVSRYEYRLNINTLEMDLINDY